MIHSNIHALNKLQEIVQIQINKKKSCKNKYKVHGLNSMVNSIRVNESTGLAHCWGNTTDDFPPEYENYECLGS